MGVVPEIRDSVFEEEQQQGGSTIVRCALWTDMFVCDNLNPSGYCIARWIGNYRGLGDRFARESREWARMVATHLCVTLAMNPINQQAIAERIDQWSTGFDWGALRHAFFLFAIIGVIRGHSPAGERDSSDGRAGYSERTFRLCG